MTDTIPERKVIAFIDLGQRNNEDGYVDSINLLCFHIRSLVVSCEECRDRMLETAEDDLKTIREADELDTLEVAESILHEWETRAEQHGLTGWASEGAYYVAWIDQ